MSAFAKPSRVGSCLERLQHSSEKGLATPGSLVRLMVDSPCSTLVDAGLGGDSEIRTIGGGCACWSIVGVDEGVDGASSRRRFEDAGIKKIVMLEFGIVVT